MWRPLKGKSGTWARFGAVSTTPQTPGSYGKYAYIRPAPKDYKKTPQQERIGNLGRKMKECAGKEGAAFRECRHLVLKGGSAK